MDAEVRRLIYQAIDQTISEADFERLQDALEHDAEVRDEYLQAVRLSERLAEIAGDSNDIETSDQGEVQLASRERQRWLPPLWAQAAVAAVVLLAVGLLAFQAGRQRPKADMTKAKPSQDNESTEAVIAGHATLRRSVDLAWTDGSRSYREGDVLADGVVQFERGVAEIDFFCGATLIVEGPAELQVESDWAVTVKRGRLRATVPPAARGFVVKAAGAEVIDLGTEFALEVGDANAIVKVLDGEVKLSGGAHDGKHLLAGESRWLAGGDEATETLGDLSTAGDVDRRREDAEQRRYETWLENSKQLRTDERLIAYYPILSETRERATANVGPGGGERDAALVGPVSRTQGRFGDTSAGLRFNRTGARLRTRIDGEFQAFTFVCWVRIDSLKHVYNSLFMGDGYENGEPHWQIREDGMLMFSVMVDDTQEVRVSNRFDKRVVRDAGLHRVYKTPPIWDISKSGQWFHLAAVYDPAARRVTQFVNGEKVSDESIQDKFFIDTLRIGPAEIGNWGQPFRKSPWFAVRNLDGVIDELAIFDAALSPSEISGLYEEGKPLGY